MAMRTGDEGELIKVDKDLRGNMESKIQGSEGVIVFICDSVFSFTEGATSEKRQNNSKTMVGFVL